MSEPVQTDATAAPRDEPAGASAGAGAAAPCADVRPMRTALWVWLIPLAALGFAGFLVRTYVVQRGTVITVRLSEGYGIKTGDALRCRGINVGRIEQVRLADALDGVVLSVRLDPQAEHLARPGSRFWVVRPQVGLGGVSGLDTITGPRHLAVLPGDAAEEPGASGANGANGAARLSGQRPQQTEFIGLDDAPIMATEPQGGLEILLYAARRGGLRAGAPIAYRQFRVGTILSVGLASDAGSVEVRAYVRPAYKQLIRDNSQFWIASGIDWRLNLKGLTVEMDSLASLLDGGIAMATPSNIGEPVSTGYRFILAQTPEDEWLTWQPAVAIGADVPGTTPAMTGPRPLRATVSRTGGHFWSRTYRQSAWLLPVADGLLGPTEMFDPADGAKAQAVLEVGGQSVALTAQAPWQSHGLALVPMKLPVKQWPRQRMRPPLAPEDCYLFADSSAAPMPLAAARLRSVDGGWQVESAIAFDEDWHGAAAISRADGKLIGILRVRNGTGAILPLPADWPPTVVTATMKR